MSYSLLQHTTAYNNALQSNIVCFCTLHCVTVLYYMLQYITTHCNIF